MREQILSEIRRLAHAKGGQPPGFRLFERETGIRVSAWRGVYWARWGDAVAEAGFMPNTKTIQFGEQYVLGRIAEACRHFGRIPTVMELRIYKKARADFPNDRAISRRFGSTANMHRELAKWAGTNETHADIAAMFVGRLFEGAEPAAKRLAEGFVYLIRWGANYKIGRGDQLERRVKQVRTGLPDSGTLVHAIRTDDPPGIEAYWHRRFADRRAENGEWFKLTPSDVAAFKRRKFQ
jgi:Meiotically up-regulated gene 113